MWNDLENLNHYYSIFPSLTFSSLLNVRGAKRPLQFPPDGRAVLDQYATCSAARIVLFSCVRSRLRCESIIPGLKGEASFSILKAADPTHSIVLYIKRFRKSCFLFFFYCCCVFPRLNNALPPQGPITADQSALGAPPPLIPPSLSHFPHLAQTHFHIDIPLSERRQHAQVWGQSKHTHLFLWTAASIL